MPSNPESPSQYPSEQTTNVNPSIAQTVNSFNLSWRVTGMIQRAMRLTGKKSNTVLEEALGTYIDDVITDRQRKV